LALAAATIVAAPLAAQIGSLPENSPYRDLEDRQRFGVVAGYLFTDKDPAGVGPKSAPMLGLRYDLHLGAAAYLNTTLFTMSSSRPVLDYTKPAATRNVGVRNFALTGATATLAIALTGERSWHSLQPLINLGTGFVSALGDINGDRSAYRFETKLLIDYGFGVRYFVSANSELRLDVNWYAWQFKYPNTYQSTAADPVPIAPNGKLSPWIFNKLLTLSYAHAIFR
jgi:hypothetical protein